LFSFQGRITRRRLAVSLCGGFLAYAILAAVFRRVEPLDTLTTLAFLWFLAGGFWKRAQDAGWPGIFGILLNFIFFVAEGTNGPNAYGPDPRQSAQVKVTPPMAQPPHGSVITSARPAGDRPREVARMRRFVCSSCGASNSQAAAPGAATCDYCGGPN
jgi:uncharacterized membrane protein YhaH (DUF805 family)